MKPLILVTGTGTEIGKTIVSRALVAAWSRTGLAVAGLKPIESGQDPSGQLGGDVLVLGQVSTFHVTRFTPPYLLRDPVSPHLAARREGRTIEPQVILDWLRPIREAADATVLELPGGLFSPISDSLTNADLVLPVEPTKVVLVAPDRLGVIHDVVATTRAARAQHITVHGLILSAPAIPDASTGTNADELSRLLPDIPVLATLPRATSSEHEPHVATALRRLGF
jgi:dethiobiotin synthetase